MNNGEERREKSKRKKVGVNGFSWSWLLPSLPNRSTQRLPAETDSYSNRAIGVIYSHLSVSRPCRRFSKGISHLVGQSFFTSQSGGGALIR